MALTSLTPFLLTCIDDAFKRYLRPLETYVYRYCILQRPILPDRQESIQASTLPGSYWLIFGNIVQINQTYLRWILIQIVCNQSTGMCSPGQAGAPVRGSGL